MTEISLYSEMSVTAVIIVTNKRKDLIFMRSKTQGINVRVTPEEKEKLLKNADYCALSLSEYLRRLGLGKNVEATVREKDYRVFRKLKQLKADYEQLEKSEIARRIDEILQELR